MTSSMRFVLLLLLQAQVSCFVQIPHASTSPQHWRSVVLANAAAGTTQDLSTGGLAGQKQPSRVRSVNYFISRVCNYSCKFCFHTQKNTNKLPLEEARRGIRLLKEAGTEKINFAGGEPFVHPKLLGELCRSSHEMGIAVSIISNGSLITPEWMKQYGRFVDILGVSVDSFDSKTNALIGRGGDANNKHLERVMEVRGLCEKHGIIFKLNTVVCSLNWQEDMNESVKLLEPSRWKAFQVLILEHENSGRPGELRDARLLQISRDQYDSFIQRHNSHDYLIPESNDVMQNSYLLLDEDLRFLDCSGGAKVPSASILDVGVEAALLQSGFNDELFLQRGGVYDWKRQREQEYVMYDSSTSS